MMVYCQVDGGARLRSGRQAGKALRPLALARLHEPPGVPLRFSESQLATADIVEIPNLQYGAVGTSVI